MGIHSMTEFGIHSRFESCDQSRVEPEIVDSTSNDLGVNDNQLKIHSGTAW